ncbi:tail fiber domain-containing protein [Chitinophaga sp. XS-30]|uniref:tail fiber domain-containing protein n=1 Tax=Chitinophaga sp. XS-30 TaxID=2604421 RepID=UPI0011DD034C|nr:tail fiber domain-containing protein [Chitinophaga sp. XS-30]QEH43688.1 tail fiber domain-containing protein [Chitinophaga sp. XS-30]
MPERSKSYLKQQFGDGERPTGADFGDLVDSFVTKIDDAVNVDANNNLNIPGGVNLGNPATGVPGTLRFSGGNVQVFDGGTFTNVGGSSGAFLPVAGGPSVAFNGGNVGIGNFPAAPLYRLEVPLGNNISEADRVRVGSAAISNGNGAFATSAQFSHVDRSQGNANFALRQNPAGEVRLNAPGGQSIHLTLSGTNTRLFVAPTGPVVIGNNALLPGATANHILQVNGDAGKLNGNVWTVLSDVRYKKDVREFDDGLDKLMQVRPVRFKYTNLPNAQTEQDEVGIIGQEMQEVFPYMVSGAGKSEEKNGKDDVLMYNGNALTYVMVNAIQELAQRVKELEAELKAAHEKQ